MRRRATLFLSALLMLTGCASGPAPEAKYRLPYRAGDRYLVVQPGPGPFSHEGTQSYAVDFAMPVGTPIVAARAGVVTAIKEDSNLRGATQDFARHGNYVRVRHDDGTQAHYLHLCQGGADVHVGQRVCTGQVIARSGHTGWSAMPHLHFQVDRFDAVRGVWTSIPIAFEDVAGDGVPGFLSLPTSANVSGTGR